MSRRVYKKHPKAFTGTQRQFMPLASSPSSSRKEESAGEISILSEVSASIPVEMPATVETASDKKLAIAVRHPSCSAPSQESGTELEYVGKGYRLVNCESLSLSVSKMHVCNVCGSSLILREDLASRRWL